MKNLIFVAVLMTALSGCIRPQQKSSVLLIGVESLGFDVVSCGADPYESKDMPGFNVFCNESVRFTHAYTPSTMSQATWASMLTAKYPSEHGVHNNGPDFLRARFETVPEQAVHAKYHTAFFSGGPPIFRKSGLAQGFEIFDDLFEVQRQKPYRSARETFDRFLNWLTEDIDNDPFFAAIHIADLQFPEVSTVNEFGEIRERSFSSQLKAVGEGLAHLIEQMKKHHQWNSTTVILTGLNGSGRIDELFSGSTQVALFLKPQRRTGQEPSEWKIDRSVSLVDVGQTMFDLMQLPQTNKTHQAEFQIASLKNVLERPDVDWPEKRFILSETGWPAWRNRGGLRAAVRQDPYLFIFDEKPKLYNIFIDQHEAVSPMSSQIEPFREILRRSGYRAYHETISENQLLEETKAQSGGIAAKAALQERNWSELDELGKTNHKPLWQLVARRNLNQPYDIGQSDCGLFYTFRPPQQLLRNCKNQSLLALVAWIQEKQESEKKILQEQFFIIYLRELMLQRLNRLNTLHQLSWDTDLNSVDEPTLADLYLALPENKMYLSIAKSRSSKEDRTLDLSPTLEF